MCILVTFQLNITSKLVSAACRPLSASELTKPNDFSEQLQITIISFLSTSESVFKRKVANIEVCSEKKTVETLAPK